MNRWNKTVMRMMGAALAVTVAFAQPPQAPLNSPVGQPPAGDTGDAPDRGVARLSFMNGNVSVRRGDSGDLVAAVLNTPLVATDRLVTGDGARAEVELDYANLVRLGPSTEIRFGDLAYGRFQIQIATGTVTFRVLRDSTAQVEISTPSVAVHPLKTGIYRVTVKPDGTSEISVRSGDAEVYSPRGSESLHAGRSMLARGPANDPEFQVTGLIPEDEFDRWSASRDRDLERSSSYRHVSRDVPGADDLDPYGHWQNDPQYGDVWVPSVDPGWAPFQCGRWVWLDYYGWTWVGCEPWGWAPYHYGRWYWGSFGWAWYPGPVLATYYWRPALVGFFGWGVPGIGIGFGFGFGNVGWVALAPFEAFRPWYGAGIYAGFRGGAVVNNATVINNTNIASMYRNARVANGVTSMNAGNFGREGVTRGTMARATPSDLARAGMMRGALPLAPSRESTQFTNRPVNTQGMPRTNDNMRFSSRMPASTAQHIPFEQQRQSLTQMSQRPSFNAGARSPVGGANGAANGGWQRFNPSSRGEAPGTGGGPANSSGGWQRLDGASRGGQEPQVRNENAPSQSRGQQSVRISPPIVQNRSSNTSGSGSSGRSSGSKGSSHGGGSHGGGHR